MKTSDKPSYSIIFESRAISILFKLIFWGLIIGLAGFHFGKIAFIENGDTQARNYIQTVSYPMLFYLFIVTAFYLSSNKELRDKLGQLRATIRENAMERAISEGENIDDYLSIFRIERIRFKARFFIRHFIYLFMLSASYYFIIYGDLLMKRIAQAGFIVLAIIYYRNFKEDPEELLNSHKYDRQRVSVDGGLAAGLDRGGDAY